MFLSVAGEGDAETPVQDFRLEIPQLELEFLTNSTIKQKID
jgi:hypothetical protein